MPIARAGDADIAYEVAGSGEPLLMIMGFAADSRMWMFQTPTFAERYRCITFDNRAVGNSTGPLEGLTMEQMASDALAVLDAEGIERAHVLGISLGGAIAQHVALKAPERIRSLVLAATWCRRNPYLPRLGRIGTEILEQVGRESVVHASMLWLFTPKFLLEHSEMADAIEAMALDQAVHPEVFTAQQGALFEHDVREALGSLEIPTLVIVGRRDVFVPPELSEEIAAAIPGAEFVLLETGHAFTIEERDAFNHAVLEFLARQ